MQDLRDIPRPAMMGRMATFRMPGAAQEPATRPRATHSFRSWLFGTVCGTLSFAVFVSCLLVWTFALIWILLPECESCGYRNSLDEALWLAWGIFFDPGTQTGLPAGAGATAGHKLVAACFSIFGFVFNLASLGVIVEWIRSTISRFRKHHKTIVANEHTVILGWTDKTLFLLKELAQMLSDSQDRGGIIVILGDLAGTEMEAEIRMAFPNFRTRWPRVRVKCMPGKPYELDDLTRVSVWAAKHVVVLGSSRKPRVADSHTITTVCALRCLPVSLAPDALVVAELKLAQNKPVARQLGPSLSEDVEVVPVTAGLATDALLVQCALNPTVGRALMDLLSFSGNQIEVVTVHDHDAHTRLLVGKRFGDVRWRLPQAVVLGLVRASAAHGIDAWIDSHDLKHDGSGGGGGGAADLFHSDASRPQMVLSPKDDEVIEPDDLLIVCASDHKAALKLDERPTRTPPKGLGEDGPKLPHRRTYRCGSSQAAQKAQASCEDAPSVPADTAGALASDGAGPSSSVVGCSGEPAVDPGGEPGGEYAGGGGEREKPALVLLVGWTPGIGPLLRAFDARLPRHSKLFVLSEKGLKHRQREMAAEGMTLKGETLPPSAGDEYLCEDGAVPGEASSAELNGLQNISVYHRVGYTTDRLALRRLPIARATVAVIVADMDDNDLQAYGGAELQIADSEAMTSTILLRQLRQEIAATPADGHLRIVTQMSDVLTRRLLEQQPTLLDGDAGVRAGSGGRRGGAHEQQMAFSHQDNAIIFHRNYMETTALSVAAHSAVSWSVLRMLLYPIGGADIVLVPAFTLLRPLERREDEPYLCYWDLAERVRELNLGVLIGWNRQKRKPVVKEASRRSWSRHSRTSARKGMEKKRRSGSMVRHMEEASKDGSDLPAPDDNVELNPDEKDKPLPWCEADLLLVVQESHPDGRPRKASMPYGSALHESSIGQLDLKRGSINPQDHLAC